MADDDREAHLRDAVMSATARDKTFHETGRLRDEFRAMLAIVKLAWRVRRVKKAREDDPHDH